MARPGAAPALAIARDRARLSRRARLVAHRTGRSGRLRHLHLHDAGSIPARRRLPALGVSDRRRLALCGRDLAGRRRAHAERAADDRVPAGGGGGHLVAVHTMERLARSARRSLAAERVCLGVQVRPRAGGAAGRRSGARLPGAVRPGGLRARHRRGRQVDAGAGSARAARVAARVKSRAGRIAARGGIRGRVRGADAPVPRVGTRRRVGGVLDPGRPHHHRRVVALPAAALARPGRARRGLHARGRGAGMGRSGRHGRSAADPGRSARACVASAWSPGCGSRACGAGARGVPAHEPHLQLAVPRRGARRVGDRDRAARPQPARTARCWELLQPRRACSTRSSTRSCCRALPGSGSRFRRSCSPSRSRSRAGCCCPPCVAATTLPRREIRCHRRRGLHRLAALRGARRPRGRGGPASTASPTTTTPG